MDKPRISVIKAYYPIPEAEVVIVVDVDAALLCFQPIGENDIMAAPTLSRTLSTPPLGNHNGSCARRWDYKEYNLLNVRKYHIAAQLHAMLDPLLNPIDEKT